MRSSLPVSLLKRRRELPRKEAMKLWSQKRQQGWTVCPPQWAIAPHGQSRRP